MSMHYDGGSGADSLPELQKRARLRLVQMHFEAGVGHIGGNLSAIDALIVLYHRVITSSDTFVLSKGHSAGALYVALWSKGLLTDFDLQTFHRDGTRLAGHPAPLWCPHIPFATGSLGHGLANAVGMALGKRLQGVPGHVYCMTSDGEWQEGSTWEALMAAAHHRLGNLSVLIDENGLQGFGSTSEVASMWPIADKLAGREVDLVTIDGHNVTAIAQALLERSNRPRVVILRTQKGRGVSFMEDRMEWHYLPLNEAQYHAAMAEIERE